MQPTSIPGDAVKVTTSAVRLRARRLWVTVHRWLGLTVGLILLVAAVSGSAMLVLDHLDEVLNERLFHVPGPLAVDYPAVLSGVRVEVGPNAALTLRPPRAQSESFQAIVAGEWRGTIYLNPQTGEVLGRRAATEGLMGFLFTLHSSLFAGETGRAALTLAALAYLFMFATGVYLWWPVRWRQALTVRWSAGGVRALFDWHRVSGVALGLVVLVSVTSGAYMAWPPIAKSVSVLSGAPLSAPPRITGGPPDGQTVGLAVRRSLEAFPGAVVGYVQVPAAADQPIRVRLRLSDDPHPNGLTSVWFDPATAKVLQVNRWTELDPGTRAYAYIYPLHTGELGGLPWTVTTFIVGLALAAYSVTGVLLWWRRRSRRSVRIMASAQ